MFRHHPYLWTALWLALCVAILIWALRTFG